MQDCDAEMWSLGGTAATRIVIDWAQLKGIARCEAVAGSSVEIFVVKAPY